MARATTSTRRKSTGTATGRAATISAATLAAGRYELEKTLGGGGMAIVYLARDTDLGRAVAVKLLAENLADDLELRRRFVREARLAARLSHPNVVAVFDAGEEDGRPFIVMECVEGESLAETVRRDGRLEPDRVRELALQACAGLEHAHRAGLIHRDIKPGNLLVTADGTLKIADFGIAHAVEGTRLTEVGTVLGTAAYLSPEQASGEPVTPASDLYSLGACLYELLAGRPPYGYETIGELLARRSWGPPPALEGVPADLAGPVQACLARDPAERPPSAAALARELASAPTAPATAATRVARRPAVTFHVARRSVWGVALLVLALGLVVAVVAFTATSGDGGGGSGSEPPASVPQGATPAQDFRNLADWLREQGRR